MTEIYYAEIEDLEYQIEIISDKQVAINGKLYNFDFQVLRQLLSYSLLIEGDSYEVNVYQDNGIWEVLLRGKQFSVTVADEREKRIRLATGQEAVSEGSATLLAPMPGVVIEIPVVEGQEVQEGEVLVILESMKMQNELKSPQDGIVTEIRVSEGENVDQKQIMIVIDPKES